MNNLEKEARKSVKRIDLRKFVAGGLATAVIASASLTGCDVIRATDMPATITSGVTPEASPTLSPEPTFTPTPEPTSTPVPTPTEIPPTPTPERAKPSVITYHGNEKNPELTFTFDDSGDNLQKILETCRQKGIKATFFLLTGELRAHPDVWRQAVKDGFQVCNHGTSHNMKLGQLPEADIVKDTLGWEKACKEILGEEYFNRMKRDFPYYRSPGGNRTPLQQQVLGDLGYPITAYWGAEECYFLECKKAADAKSLAADPNFVPINNDVALKQHYVDRAKNGAIFLIHGGKYYIVGEVIDRVQAKGYTFKTLSEILD